MRNLVWVGSAQVAKALVAFGSLAILSRLVPPAAFGAFAAVLAIIGIAEIFRDFGLSLAAIQASSLSTTERTNLFWANTLIGGALTLLLLILSSPISDLLNIPGVQALMALVSTTFLIGGVSAQYKVHLIRDGLYGRLSAIEVGSAVIGLVVAIAVAVTGAGAVALAMQAVAGALITLLLLVLVVRWRPGLPNRRSSVRTFVSFGTKLLTVQVVSYFSTNIDKIGIGRLYGAVDLGYYAKAFTLYMQPLSQLFAPFTNLVVSRLSARRGSAAEYLQLLLRVQRATAYLGLAVFAYAFGSAPALVPALLGPAWGPSVSLFQIFCIGGVFQLLGFVYYWMFLSSAAMTTYVKCVAVSQPLAILIVILALPFGTHLVAWAVTAGNILEWVVPATWGAKKVIGRFGIVLLNARDPLLVAAAVGVGAWVTFLVTDAGFQMGLLLSLLGASALGAVVVAAVRPIRNDFVLLLKVVSARLRGSLRRTGSGDVA